MAQIESVIEPNSITNNFRWKSVTLISVHCEIMDYLELTCQYLALGVADAAPFMWALKLHVFSQVH